MSLTVYTNDVAELRQKLEAGHRVEWSEIDENDVRWFCICQKRGKEYVTVKAHSEKQAARDWETIHRKGYVYDQRRGRRLAIPGAR